MPHLDSSCQGVLYTNHMPVVLFLLRRTGRLLLTVLLISSIVFVIVRVIPGDPARVIAGLDADPADVETIRRSLGMDVPLFRQYGQWLIDVARLDFGRSFISDRPVTGLIFERFPVTLVLGLSGLLVALLIALPLGVLSAVHRFTVWDYAGMVFSQAGMAVPSFWLGILLLLIFSVKIRLFPFFGAGSIGHFVLPALSLGIARAAVLLRLTRSSMIDELGKEYIVTARSKGLTPAMVKYKHALKNALLPVITIAGIQLGYMLGGAIIIEQVFSLPGLGRLFLSAVYQRDFPLIQGGVVFVAVVFSLVNFAVDILYSVVNPKIRLG